VRDFGAARRVLRVELRRGVAPLLAVGLFAAGLYQLGSQPGAWAGRWGALAELLSARFALFGALVVAAAAWQGGRERRHRLDELIASTPRPLWHRVVVLWVAISLGALAGFAALWAVGAGLVAPVATYPGRGWVWLVAVTALGLCTAVAIGVATARLVPSRLTAPLAALVAAVVLYSAVGDPDDPTGTLWLTPASPVIGGHHFVDLDVRLWQMVWLLGLLLSALVLTSTRRRLLVALPLVVAVAGFFALVTGGGGERLHKDPAATTLVCTEPPHEVCLTRVDSYLLDDVAGPARALLARWEGIPGAPGRISNDPLFWAAFDEEGQGFDFDATIFFGYISQDVFGRATDVDLVGATRGYLGSLSWRCETELVDPDLQHALFDLNNVVLWWSMKPLLRYGAVDEGRVAGAAPLFPPYEDRLEALLAMPEQEQKDVIGRFLAAVRTCDGRALAHLSDQLA
jgi:hypothetical protein